jgi:hypothetical protein
MQQEVLERRHGILVEHFLEFVCMLFFGPVPVREIDMHAALLHIVIDQLGGGGDIAVPGPAGLIAVTVKTGTLGQRTRFRAVPIRLGIHGRIGVIVSIRYQLDQQPDCQYANNTKEKYSFHPFTRKQDMLLKDLYYHYTCSR